jgi:hypothetical protein
MKGDGPSCSLDRLETSAGDFFRLDEFLDQVEAARIGERVEDMLRIDGGWMVWLVH